MSKQLKTLGIAISLVVCLAAVTFGQDNHANGNGNGNGNGRSAVLKVNPAQIAWAESHITEKLMSELSRNGNGEVITAEELPASMPPFPTNFYSSDSLANWGLESGRRYLLIVTVEFEGLKRERTFNVPLIVSKYENIGVAIGELRIFDVSRRKVVLAESFTFEKEAKRIFQGAIDDDIYDADLHISAPEKLRFFSELESELAVELSGKIRNATSLH